VEESEKSGDFKKVRSYQTRLFHLSKPEYGKIVASYIASMMIGLMYPLYSLIQAAFITILQTDPDNIM